MSQEACNRCRAQSARLAARCGSREGSAPSQDGVWSACVHTRGFPSRLKDLSDPPHALFCCGDRAILPLLDGDLPIVTIVGSRRATSTGIDFAAGLARSLAEAGVLVVSGLAAGIDGAAHRGAIESGRTTVAVMGGGPDIAYPARHRALHRRLAEGDGLVISELAPGTRPTKWTFPARNRIMAALAAMTVIVEAREGSGSLITAGFAAEIGREVGAVPGSVGHANSAGTNALLKDGAHVVRGPDDVFDVLQGMVAIDLRRRPIATGPRINEKLQAVMAAVESEPGSADAIAIRDGFQGIEVAVSLARLELLGYVDCGEDGCFRRTSLAAPPSLSSHER